MPAQSPSAIELEFARHYDQEHARVCLQPRAQGLGERLPSQLSGGQTHLRNVKVTELTHLDDGSIQTVDAYLD